MRLRTLALLIGIAVPPVGAWVDMHSSLARLEQKTTDIDRRLARIESSVYGVAAVDVPEVP